MPIIRMRHVAIINKLSDIHQRIISYVSLRHVTDINASYHTYGVAMLFARTWACMRLRGGARGFARSLTQHTYIYTCIHIHKGCVFVSGKGGYEFERNLCSYMNKSFHIVDWVVSQIQIAVYVC